MGWSQEKPPISRVLILDDDEAQSRTLAAILRDDGFEVICCLTAREAVDRFGEGNVDVGIIDLRLPDVDEAQLLDRLAEVAEDVPLIIHTGYSSYESARKAVNVGAFAYVEKRSEPTELVSQVYRAVHTRVKRYAEALESAVAARTRELREREKELAHLGRLSTMGEMATGIAHELRQPLYAITNYAAGISWHLQNATADPQELTEAMEKITAQARRASDIIGRLRSTVQKCEPRRSSTDMNELLDDVLQLVEHELRQEGVAVHLDQQDKLPLVLADAIQIQQVAVNLIRNALDAMRDMPSKEKQLTLATSIADGDAVEVCVADTGIGLSEEVRRKIFDAFFTTKAEGLGMGLAICQTIIERHEGRIWATPNSPHGTVFRFVMPTVPRRVNRAI